MYFPSTLNEYLVLYLLGVYESMSATGMVRSLNSNKITSTSDTPNVHALFPVIHNLEEKGMLRLKESKVDIMGGNLESNYYELTDMGIKIFENIDTVGLYIRTCKMSGRVKPYPLIPSWEKLKDMCNDFECDARTRYSCYHRHAKGLAHVLNSYNIHIGGLTGSIGTSFLMNVFSNPIELQELIYWLSVKERAKIKLKSENNIVYLDKLDIKIGDIMKNEKGDTYPERNINILYRNNKK